MQHAMASPARTGSKVTLYLIYLVFVTTLGPLQFGYHLVYTNLQSLIGIIRTLGLTSD